MPAYVKSPKKDCPDCKAGMCMAHGGEAKMPKHEETEMEEKDMPDEDELHEALGEELTSAMHRKDHKGVMQALEACMDNHMSKRGKE